MWWAISYWFHPPNFWLWQVLSCSALDDFIVLTVTLMSIHTIGIIVSHIQKNMIFTSSSYVFLNSKRMSTSLWFLLVLLHKTSLSSLNKLIFTASGTKQNQRPPIKIGRSFSLSITEFKERHSSSILDRMDDSNSSSRSDYNIQRSGGNGLILKIYKTGGSSARCWHYS